MKKIFVLLGYNLGLWGLFGFFVTLFFGFLACCTNLSENIFYGFLIVFGLTGLTVTCVCVLRGCKKQ